MATYTELAVLSESGDLLQKVAVACVIQANVIRGETSGTNLTNRQAWARSVLADPKSKAKQMLWAALAQNAGLTSAQISGATDASLLSAVAAAVDLVAP